MSEQPMAENNLCSGKDTTDGSGLDPTVGIHPGKPMKKRLSIRTKSLQIEHDPKPAYVFHQERRKSFSGQGRPKAKEAISDRDEIMERIADTESLLGLLLEAAGKETISADAVRKVVPMTLDLLNQVKPFIEDIPELGSGTPNFFRRQNTAAVTEQEQEVLQYLVGNFTVQTASSAKSVADSDSEVGESPSSRSAATYLASIKTAKTFICKMKNKANNTRNRKRLDSVNLTWQIHDSTKLLLARVGEWDFDIFELHRVAGDKLLPVITLYLFDEMNMFDHFNIDIDVFISCMLEIQKGYLDNPYHSALHAADVVQSISFFVKSPSFAEKLSECDLVASLLAAAIHDLGHPGTTNSFQIATESEVAMQYNDQAVLENMHCARAFAIINKEKCRIRDSFSPAVWKELRSTIISLVLATDMSKHFQLQSELEALKHSKNAEGQRLVCLKAALHSADIGHPAKPTKFHSKWTEMVQEEFYLQGDRERALQLPISPLMDRNKPNVATSQIGFIEHIVRPLYHFVETFIPEASVCMEWLDTNTQHWKNQGKPVEVGEVSLQAIDEDRSRTSESQGDDGMTQE